MGVWRRGAGDGQAIARTALSFDSLHRRLRGTSRPHRPAMMRAMPLAFQGDDLRAASRRNISLATRCSSRNLPSRWRGGCLFPGGRRLVRLFTGEKIAGGQVRRVAKPIDQLPVYGRAGHALALGRAMQHTGEIRFEESRSRNSGSLVPRQVPVVMGGVLSFEARGSEASIGGITSKPVPRHARCRCARSGDRRVLVRESWRHLPPIGCHPGGRRDPVSLVSKLRTTLGSAFRRNGNQKMTPITLSNGKLSATPAPASAVPLRVSNTAQSTSCVLHPPTPSNTIVAQHGLCTHGAVLRANREWPIGFQREPLHADAEFPARSRMPFTAWAGGAWRVEEQSASRAVFR